MTLRAVINGISYTDFKEYDISRSVEDVAGQFSITMTTQGNQGIFQVGDKIIIYVNNTPILTGHIEKKKVGYDHQSHDIQIQGRDNVADLVDSTIGNKIEFKAPVTLEKVIQSVLSDIQMTGVKVVNKASGLKPFLQGEIVSGEIDETIFDFLEKYTRKRQVLMTTDGKGNLILTRAGTTQASTKLVHRVAESGTEDNNILVSDVEYDDSKRFYLYRVHSQGNPSASANLGKTSNSEIVNRLGTANDLDVRHTRILDITAESATDTASLKERATWEATVRRARAISYSCTIQGHTITPNGKPWEPNLLVSINDEYALIAASLLIKSVNYILSLDDGNITQLELVHPDSYLPEPSTMTKRTKHGNIGRKKKGKKSKKSSKSSLNLLLKDIDGHLKNFPAGDS